MAQTQSSQKVIVMPPRTFAAKLFRVPWESREFKVAGTLDGFIDLATPEGTYPLDLDEARELIEALKSAVADVEKNCLYDSDALRSEEENEMAIEVIYCEECETYHVAGKHGEWIDRKDPRHSEYPNGEQDEFVTREGEIIS